MALQTGVLNPKVLVLVGAGLTGSVILRSGRLSEVLSELQELMKGASEVEMLPGKYDSAHLAAQIRQLAQEIREMSMNRPISIFNGNSSSNGNFVSYLVPAAALGAMGYCYMWWKGWTFSDVMFVTKHNMANAVATVSKQLENVSESLASTKRHLTKRLENLDWKLDEQKEVSKLIVNDVNEVKNNLNQIGLDIDTIHQLVSGLEGKLELIETKQDMTNSGLLYLCQAVEGVKDGIDAKLLQEIETKLGDRPKLTYEENPVKGLQFLTESKESIAEKISTIDVKENNIGEISAKKVITRTRVHRTYSVGLTVNRGISGLAL